MAKNNKNIIVSVGANTAEFNRAMKGINSNMVSMQKQMVSVGNVIKGALSIGAITAFGKASFDAMNEHRVSLHQRLFGDALELPVLLYEVPAVFILNR